MNLFVKFHLSKASSRLHLHYDDHYGDSNVKPAVIQLKCLRSLRKIVVLRTLKGKTRPLYKCCLRINSRVTWLYH